jgi:hypothetical protein
VAGAFILIRKDSTMFKTAFTRAERRRERSDLSYRVHRLVRGGFPGALVDTLARDPRYELDALLALTERGCPAELAARILAPLTDAPASAAFEGEFLPDRDSA